jgi:hypothetical protein
MLKSNSSVQKKRRRSKRKKSKKRKLETKLKDRYATKVFRHRKTWWLCPLCKVHRLCTGHATDGVSIGEHEADCGQAIENTPPKHVFSIPYRGSALNFSMLSLNEYFIGIHNHCLGLLSYANRMAARRTRHARGQEQKSGKLRSGLVLKACSCPLFLSRTETSAFRKTLS